MSTVLKNTIHLVKPKKKYKKIIRIIRIRRIRRDTINPFIKKGEPRIKYIPTLGNVIDY